MASSDLSALARNKMHSSVTSKESCSLHRWVLLKNSITRSTPCIPRTAAAHSADISPVNISVLGHKNVEEDGEGDDDSDLEESDSFLFPDAGRLVENQSADVNAAEAQWLDSLLETLGDDDEDVDDLAIAPGLPVSDLPTEDDEELLLSPSLSPMSSSDDLPGGHSSYFPDSIPVPYSYPVPYPPFHPPLIHSYDLEPPLHAPLSHFRPYENPLPSYDTDDIENLSVPDAIEDTSDDESDTPSTPSLGSRSSLTDPASTPSPTERTSRARLHPHVYIDTPDSYFYPFELDPLPFSDDNLVQPTYGTHPQEC